MKRNCAETCALVLDRVPDMCVMLLIGVQMNEEVLYGITAEVGAVRVGAVQVCGWLSWL